MLHTTTGGKVFVWTVLAVAILANAAGYAWGLWDRIIWFDEVAHGFTTFAVTLALVLALYDTVLARAHEHASTFVLVVIAIGLGLGVVWEFLEWGYDRLVADARNAIKGKPDTMLDLLIDGAGALLAGLAALGMLPGRAGRPSD